MNSHLSMALGAAVPLHILELQQEGGPTEEDLKEAQEVSKLLGEKGDILLFGGKKKGECADLFNKTARAMAVLAFVPGGVTLFGSHFEAPIRRPKPRRVGKRK